MDSSSLLERGAPYSAFVSGWGILDKLCEVQSLGVCMLRDDTHLGYCSLDETVGCGFERIQELSARYAESRDLFMRSGPPVRIRQLEECESYEQFLMYEGELQILGPMETSDLTQNHDGLVSFLDISLTLPGVIWQGNIWSAYSGSSFKEMRWNVLRKAPSRAAFHTLDVWLSIRKMFRLTDAEDERFREVIRESYRDFRDSEYIGWFAGIYLSQGSKSMIDYAPNIALREKQIENLQVSNFFTKQLKRNLSPTGKLRLENEGVNRERLISLATSEVFEYANRLGKGTTFELFDPCLIVLVLADMARQLGMGGSDVTDPINAICPEGLYASFQPMPHFYRDTIMWIMNMYTSVVPTLDLDIDLMFLLVKLSRSLDLRGAEEYLMAHSPNCQQKVTSHTYDPRLHLYTLITPVSRWPAENIRDCLAIIGVMECHNANFFRINQESPAEALAWLNHIWPAKTVAQVVERSITTLPKRLGKWFK